MTFQFDTNADFKAQLGQVQRIIGDYRDAIFAHEEAQAVRLYDFLAHVYACGLRWYSDETSYDALLAAWEERNIGVPKAGTNKWGPILSLVGGHFDDDNKWVRDFALAKYANALRYFEENELLPAQVVATIHGHDGKLSGIVAADRNKNGKPRAVATKEVIEEARNQKALASVAVAKPAEFSEDFGQAYGVWEGGEFKILGFVKDSGRSAQALAVKALKKPKVSEAAKQLSAVVKLKPSLVAAMQASAS